MNYLLTTPCDACPFRIGSGFTWESLEAHAAGEFGCHKACVLDEDGDYVEKPDNKTPHCAGALIFLEKQDAPHQMMRINERMGFYDMRKLDMAAPVVGDPSDCRAETPDERRRRRYIARNA